MFPPYELGEGSEFGPVQAQFPRKAQSLVQAGSWVFSSAFGDSLVRLSVPRRPVGRRIGCFL